LAAHENGSWRNSAGLSLERRYRASLKQRSCQREKIMPDIHEHHEKAAHHHEQAAKHHREAAKHHKSGAHEKGAHHSKIAHGHHLHAIEHHEHASKIHADKHGS
jgi:hypothetical protein